MPNTTIQDMPADLYHRLGFNAAGEIDSLVRMLKDRQEEDGFEFLLHGALIRINHLTSVLLSLHGGDDGRDWSEMHEVVFDKPLEVSNV